MDWLKTLFTYQWLRKVIALLTATIIWFIVNQSIIDEKIIPNVPIRVINLPEDKTVPNMQPNGIIGKRIPLTLSGTKNIIDQLEPGDIEVLLDASEVQQNDWVVKIAKKNLISLNPSIDLAHHISEVNHPEFVLKISQLLTASVPVTVLPPKGQPPQGYEYLDIWPMQLKHTVTGPQEQIQELVNNGIELIFDMNMISKADLDKIKSSRDNFHDDEVSFFIPNHWKRVTLPIKGGIVEEINDPQAQNLHIDFLRKEYFPLNTDIVIIPFYPLDTADKLNPATAPLLTDGKIKKINGVTYLSMPLFMRDVSPLFLETIRDSLEIVVIANDSQDHSPLFWNVQVVNPHLLEDKYVNVLISHNSSGSRNNEPRHTKKRELHLRARFRDYLQKLTLFTAPDKKLQLDARLSKEGISIIPSAH